MTHGAFYNDLDPYCCGILAQQIAAGALPAGTVTRGDVRKLSATALRRYSQIHLFAGIGGMPYGLRLGGWPDDQPILTAGFPCQPVSLAGKGLAQADDRWLWPEVLRVLRVVRPRLALLENVPGLLVRGMDAVLGDLAQSGYDASWRPLAAADVGAPHLRERIWIVAYPMRPRLEGKRETDCIIPDAACLHLSRPRLSESDIVRKRDGIPHFVDRIKALGNAVVPQCVAALVPWIREEGMA